MSTVISWVLAYPLYVIGMLVGLALGIFYGFDGWRGNTAEIEQLQDSPRVRNLIWILGAGFTAFFGDIKALDPQANRALLLVAYFFPCIVAGTVVVVGWGVIIAIGRGIASFQGRDIFTDALGDYFFYGYRHYRARVQAAREARAAREAQVASESENVAARFHAAYVTQLSYAITAAGSASADTYLAVAQEIRRCIAAVVRSYHRDDTDALRIRANLMLINDCTDELRKQLIFIGQDRTQVTRCLNLAAFDVDENQPKIVLPLANGLAGALPGAPTAVFHPDGIDVIDDTSQIDFRPTIPQQVRDEVNEYFMERVFKSFGSIRIIGKGGHTLGVVNLECRTTHVFGETPQEKQRISKYQLPFCAALSIVLSQPERKEIDGYAERNSQEPSGDLQR